MTKKIVFGGGCFWCTEAAYRRVKGVRSVTPGYAGGRTDNPDYESVSGGDTGHAEVVEVEYDPMIVAFDRLLEVFETVHDPTSLNQQGADIGTEYRSIILYTNDEQEGKAREWKENFSGSVTEIKLLEKFFPAEDYHRQYFERNGGAPYCNLVIVPKLSKLMAKHKELLIDRQIG